MNRVARRFTSILLGCSAALWFTVTDNASAQSPFTLTDVSQKCGIRALHDSGPTGKNYIIETVCSGVALFDYDGDGLIDVYLLSGKSTPMSQRTIPSVNRLYRNLGEFQFSDVTESAGVGDPGHGLGVATGDFDNDGDQDLYVSNYGPNVFYCNNGDGTFTQIDVGVTPNEVRVGAGVSFLDIEQDGDLDLYVAHYIKFDYSKDINRMIYGIPAAPGPKDYKPDSDSLYRNDGNGRFTDITMESGIGKVAGTGMGLVSLDYDRDGDTDIFICNDSAANFLFENDGKGHFKEVGLLTGVAYNYAGLAQASMGVASGDYDNDGHLDLVTTNFEDEVPALYRNSGQGFFDDEGISAGLGVATRSVKWGVSLSDFDNDSNLDLFIACGHLIDTVGKRADTRKFAARNLLFQNTSRRKFVDVSDSSGDGLQIEAVSRGVGCDDLDNDGDLDLVILNLNATPSILRNDSGRSGNWLDLQLIGTQCNRDGAGAFVTCEFDGKKRVQEQQLGKSYQSHFGSRLHHGLGNATTVQRVTVRWLGGETEMFEKLPINQTHLIRQGSGRSVLSQ